MKMSTVTFLNRKRATVTFFNRNEMCYRTIENIYSTYFLIKYIVIIRNKKITVYPKNQQLIPNVSLKLLSEDQLLKFANNLYQDSTNGNRRAYSIVYEHVFFNKNELFE